MLEACGQFLVVSSSPGTSASGVLTPGESYSIRTFIRLEFAGTTHRLAVPGELADRLLLSRQASRRAATNQQTMSDNRPQPDAGSINTPKLVWPSSPLTRKVHAKAG